MASKMTKAFIAIFVIIVGLLVLNFSINVDLSKVLTRALATGVNKNQSGNRTIDGNCGEVSQIEECKDCLRHQLVNYPECKETGKRQKNRCSKSKKEFYTSCRTNEEKKFWIFQITALVLGLLSSSIVWCRSKHLDEHVLGKIRKQISGDS
ncbi:protein JTB-like [Dendronephthya gigantea]|uniref:protein JTB-like n=1 Tax=Dendronephthya gigantea TaxID=151771 RepID=UPI00106D9D15|nr:protein JTB-like [Dendronephthya gigantea]